MAFIKWLCDRYQSNTIKTLVRKKKIPPKNFFDTQRPVFLLAHVVTLFLINKTDTLTPGSKLVVPRSIPTSPNLK